MADSDRMVCHLPERVLRQYRYVHTVPRAPTDIVLLAADDVAQAFMEFALRVLNYQQRGHPVPDNQSWAHTKGYMRWFVRVTHPIVNPPAAIPDYAADAPPRHVPPYEEVIVEQLWPGILSTHTKSSATSEPEWTGQWGILMCFVIQRRLCA